MSVSFWERLMIEFVDVVKQIALPHVGGHHSIHWGLEENEKVEENWIYISFFSLDSFCYMQVSNSSNSSILYLDYSINFQGGDNFISCQSILWRYSSYNLLSSKSINGLLLPVEWIPNLAWQHLHGLDSHQFLPLTPGCTQLMGSSSTAFFGAYGHVCVLLGSLLPIPTYRHHSFLGL